MRIAASRWVPPLEETMNDRWLVHKALKAPEINEPLLFATLVTALDEDLVRKNEHGETVLMFAMERCCSAGVIQALLSRPALCEPQLLNAKSVQGWTALHKGVTSNCVHGVKALLQARADPETQITLGYTAAHWAVLFDRYEVLDILLNGGALQESQDHEGQTVLMLAAKSNSNRCVELLKQHHQDRVCAGAYARLVSSSSINHDMLAATAPQNIINLVMSYISCRPPLTTQRQSDVFRPKVAKIDAQLNKPPLHAVNTKPAPVTVSNMRVQWTSATPGPRLVNEAEYLYVDGRKRRKGLKGADKG